MSPRSFCHLTAGFLTGLFHTGVGLKFKGPLPASPHRMLEYSLDLQNVSFSAVRTVRVLRPLRAINRVPSE